MSESPNKTDFVANARRNWGDPLPEWIEALATECNRTSGAATAKRLGISGAQVSQIISGVYKGDLVGAEAKVRGALLGLTVECPIVGELRRDACLNEQKKTHVGASEIRAALYRACRGGCPHSRLKIEEANNV